MSIDSVSSVAAGAAAKHNAGRAASAQGARRASDVVQIDGRGLEPHDCDADGRMGWQDRLYGDPTEGGEDTSGPPSCDGGSTQGGTNRLDLTG